MRAGCAHRSAPWGKAPGALSLCLKPEQFALQRLQTVRKALRNALTNLKKTYQSVLELSFPELGQLLEVDGAGIRAASAKAPTPQASPEHRLSTLEKNWMLRPKAAALKALAADSIADPELAAASAPALQAILQSPLAALEGRLRSPGPADRNRWPQSSRSRNQSTPANHPRLRPHHRRQSPGLPSFGAIAQRQ